jgi:hypothetical protein
MYALNVEHYIQSSVCRMDQNVIMRDAHKIINSSCFCPVSGIHKSDSHCAVAFTEASALMLRRMGPATEGLSFFPTEFLIFPKADSPVQRHRVP